MVFTPNTLSGSLDSATANTTAMALGCIHGTIRADQGLAPSGFSFRQIRASHMGGRSDI